MYLKLSEALRVRDGHFEVTETLFYGNREEHRIGRIGRCRGATPDGE